MRFSVFLDYIYVIVFYLEFQVIVYTQYIHHLLYGNQFKLSGELIVHKIFFIIVYSDPIPSFHTFENFRQRYGIECQYALFPCQFRILLHNGNVTFLLISGIDEFL